jgi:hypothetical protein
MLSGRTGGKPFGAAHWPEKQFEPGQLCGILATVARVAQLDRVSASEAEGCGFDPRRAQSLPPLRHEVEGETAAPKRSEGGPGQPIKALIGQLCSTNHCMKTILPWVLAILGIGAAVGFFKANQTRSAEVVKLQADLQELETLRLELTELKSQQVPAAEITQLRKDKEDLLRLRNEVTRLRNEQQQLTKQAQSAQSALAGAQAETQRAQAQAMAQAQAQALNNAQIVQQVEATNICINHLRQMDGAKQQWALEHQKTAEAVPTAPEIAPYLKEPALVCPASGKYTLQAVGAVPTCSIPGHALPQP